MNPLLLELAKLDFNLIQSMHKRELKEVSSHEGERLDIIPPTLREPYIYSINWFLSLLHINHLIPSSKDYSSWFSGQIFCKSYLVEARWYHHGCTPSLVSIWTTHGHRYQALCF
ncbi:unnamed protein product [Musa acuminata subsp. burmannicoides]